MQFNGLIAFILTIVVNAIIIVIITFIIVIFIAISLTFNSSILVAKTVQLGPHLLSTIDLLAEMELFTSYPIYLLITNIGYF